MTDSRSVASGESSPVNMRFSFTNFVRQLVELWAGGSPQPGVLVLAAAVVAVLGVAAGCGDLEGFQDTRVAV